MCHPAAQKDTTVATFINGGLNMVHCGVFVIVLGDYTSCVNFYVYKYRHMFGAVHPSACPNSSRPA